MFFKGTISKKALDKVFDYTIKTAEDYNIGDESCDLCHEVCNGKKGNAARVKELRKRLESGEIKRLHCSWKINGDHVLSIKKTSDVEKFDVKIQFDHDPFEDMPFEENDGVNGLGMDNYGTVYMIHGTSPGEIKKSMDQCDDVASYFRWGKEKPGPFRDECKARIVAHVLENSDGRGLTDEQLLNAKNTLERMIVDPKRQEINLKYDDYDEILRDNKKIARKLELMKRLGEKRNLHLY
jgi:hypothetical protein